MWNEKSQLLERSYYISDLEDYFKYVIEKHETVTDNPPIRTYVNKIENKIEFKIKRGCYLELLTSDTMKLLGALKAK